MNTADAARDASVASTANVPTSVVARIRKLLALAGNNSNPNEAASAAAQAAEMMRQYKLESAALRVESAEPAEAIEHGRLDVGTTKLPGWKGRLVVALGFLGVNPWVEQARSNNGFRSHIRLFGRQSDVQAAAYIFEYLCTEIERLAQRERNTGRAYRNAFRLGAATTVYKRLEAAQKAQAKPSDERALAVIAKDDAEVEAGWQVVRKQNHLVARGHASCSNGDGYTAGKKAGESISIPGREQHKGLGTAPRQLGAR